MKKPDPEEPFRKALKPLPWKPIGNGPAWDEPIQSRKSQLDQYERKRPSTGATDPDMEKRLGSRVQRRIRAHIQRGVPKE